MLSSAQVRAAPLHKPLLFIDENTKVVVQGIGKQGQFHAKLMREYGTKVVGGVQSSRPSLIA